MMGMDPTSNRPMIVRGDSTSDLLRVSRTFETQLGLSPVDLIQRPLIGWIHPGDRAPLEAVLVAGDATIAARHQTAQGDWARFDWDIRTHDGQTVALGLPHDESTDNSTPVAPSTTGHRSAIAQKLETMALIVEAKNPGMKCSILLIDQGGQNVKVGAGPSLPAEYNTAVEGLRIGPGVESCGTAAFWNVPVVVEDIQHDPLWTDLRDTAGNAELRACWSHPILSTSGEVLGAMALYNAEPSIPEKHHMDGLEIASRMVGMAVEQEELERQLSETAENEAVAVLAGGIAHDFNKLLVSVLGNAELALA